MIGSRSGGCRRVMIMMMMSWVGTDTGMLAAAVDAGICSKV